MPDYENLKYIHRLIGEKFHHDSNKPRSLVEGEMGDERLSQCDHESLKALKRRDLWGDDY